MSKIVPDSDRADQSTKLQFAQLFMVYTVKPTVAEKGHSIYKIDCLPIKQTCTFTIIKLELYRFTIIKLDFCSFTIIKP